MKNTKVELELLTECLINDLLFMLAWVAWVVCLRGWHASLRGVGGMLPWVAWVVCLHGWCGWLANVGYVVGVLVWVSRQHG